MPDAMTSESLQLVQEGAPCLLLCAGKDCARKERKAFKALRSTATSAGLDVGLIRCQGSCEGPTAVVVDHTGPRWFERLQAVDTHQAVVSLASGAANQPTKKLAKRELSGKRRRKAAKKLGVKL